MTPDMHDLHSVVDRKIREERARIANVLRFHAPHFLGIEDVVYRVADDIEAGEPMKGIDTK
jgi:hypothetical protein